MRGLSRLLGLATLTAAIGAAVAIAQEVDRVRVGGSNTTLGFQEHIEQMQEFLESSEAQVMELVAGG